MVHTPCALMVALPFLEIYASPIRVGYEAFDLRDNKRQTWVNHRLPKRFRFGIFCPERNELFEGRRRIDRCERNAVVHTRLDSRRSCLGCV